MTDIDTRPGSRAAVGRVLANRQLRRIVSISAVSTTAEMGGWIALTTIAFRMGGVDEASRLLVAELLPSALVALSVGMLISRWGTTKVLAVASVAEAIGFAAIAISLAAGMTGPEIYAGAIVASVCMVAIRPSVAAALPTLVSVPSELTAANVVIGWVTAAAAMVGPLIVAATINFGSGAVPLGVFALAAAISAAFAIALPTFRPHPEADGSGRGGLRRASRAGGPMLAVVVLASGALVAGCLDLLYIVVGVEVLGRDASIAGWLNTAAGAGAVLGGAVAIVLVGRRWLWPWLLLAGAFSSVMLAMLGLPRGVGPAMVLFGGVQLGVTFMTIAARTLLQRLADLELLGHLAAIAESAEMTMLLVGALVLPAAVHWFGASGAGAAVGAVLLVLVASCALWISRAESGAALPIERYELIGSNHLFALLPPPAIEALVRSAAPVRLADGEVLFHEGEAGDRYFVVASGQVRITQGGTLLAERGRGEGFGELALRHRIGRTATATANGPVELLGIDGSTFLFAVTGHPETRARIDEVSRAQGIVRPADDIS